MSSRSSSWGTGLLIVLVIAFLIGLASANGRFTQNALDPNTFLPRWQAARAWLQDRTSPYDSRVAVAAQMLLYGRPAIPEQGEDPSLFTDPLPALLPYLPWGLLDYPAARAGWMTLLEVLLVISAILSLRLSDWRPPPMLYALVVAFAVAWPPGIRSIVDGHAAVVSLVCTLGSIWLLERRQDVAAGALLALAMVDPVVGSLVLVTSLAWAASTSRWHVVGSALAAIVIVLGVSLRLMSDWPLGWLRQVAFSVQWQREFGIESALLAQGFRGAPAFLAAALLLAAAFSLWSCLGHGPRWLWWTVASILVLGAWLTRVVVGTSSLVHLFPAAVLVLGGAAQRLPKIGNWLVAGVLLVGGLVLWLLSLSAPVGGKGGIFIASAAPALAFLGLLWVRWWVTRGPQLRGLALGED